MGRKRTGSIRQVGPNSFEVRLAGKQVGTFDDEATAQRRLRAMLAQESGTSPQTFGVFADEWWDELERDAMRRGENAYASYKKNRSRWRAHVVDAPFYDLPFKQHSVQLFQQWVTDLSKKEAVHAITYGRGASKRVELRPTGEPIGRKVVSESLNLVQLCIDAAIRAGRAPGLIVDGKVTAGNCARMVLLPRAAAADLVDDEDEDESQLIVHLTAVEIETLLSSDLPAFQRAVFTLAIYVGLRRGELWGLRIKDLTLDGAKPHVRVRRSYNGPTKTRNSKRDVPLLPPAVEALRAYLAEQPARIGSALVFPAADGKCYSRGYDAGWRDHPQKRADGKVHVTPGWRSLAGIRDEVSFLELRHTCGCHLAQGTWLGRRFDLHQIKKWLGHSSIAVTERHYASLTADNLHDAVADAGYVGYMWGSSK
jgi:integrase